MFLSFNAYLIISSIYSYFENIHCIYTLSISPYFKVQVVTSRVPCAAHLTDYLSLPYPLAHCNGDSRTVGV